MDSNLRIYIDEKFAALTLRMEGLFAARVSASNGHRSQDRKLVEEPEVSAFEMRALNRKLAELEDEMEDLRTEIDILTRRHDAEGQPALLTGERLLEERIERLAKEIRQRFRIVNQRFEIPVSDATRFESGNLGMKIEAPFKS